MSKRYVLNKEEYCQQYGSVGGTQLVFLHRKKYLTDVYIQNCLCGSFGVQVGCLEIPVEPKNEEASLNVNAGPTNCGPIDGAKTAHLPMDFALALPIHSSAPSPFHQRTQQMPHL